MGGIYDDISIEQLKNRIRTKLNIVESQQLLSYQKQTLWHDHRTLRQYRIHDGATISLRVYTEQKIKKLRQQYIFTKSIDKAYKGLEPEFSVTSISESDLRSEVDPKELYEQAFKEAIEWQNLDEWMSKKLKVYLYQIQQERSTTYKQSKGGGQTIHSNKRSRGNSNTTSQRSVQYEFKSINSKSDQNHPRKMSTIEEMKGESLSLKSQSPSKGRNVNNNNNNNNNNNSSNNNNSNNITYIDNNVTLNLNMYAPKKRKAKKSKKRVHYKNNMMRNRIHSRSNGYNDRYNNNWNKNHKIKSFKYRDKLFCCHETVKVKRYMIVLVILLILLGIASFFVYLEHLRIKMLSDNYWIKSTCFLYDYDYGIWIKYEEYNNNQQQCKQNNINNVTHWDGDIQSLQIPNNSYNNYDSSTNRNIYNNNNDNNNNNITSTFIQPFLEYTCYVNQECDEITVTTNDKSTLKNPYQWDSTVIYVVTIFIWICAGFCVVTLIYLLFGYRKSRKTYFKDAWNKIPKMWQCYYYLKHNDEYFYCHAQEDVAKGPDVEKAPDGKVIGGIASTKHIASIIFSYWPILDDEQPPKHFEPSKSSKSMGSVNIIYASDKSRDRTISHNYRARKATLSATDRTASSNKTASREESKSL